MDESSKIFYLCEQKRYDYETSESAENALKDQNLVKIFFEPIEIKLKNKFIEIGIWCTSFIVSITKRGELLQSKIEKEIDSFVSKLFEKTSVEDQEELKIRK